LQFRDLTIVEDEASGQTILEIEVRGKHGVGYYKGNFGNMFFLWDVLFGTALISRKYPESYGISHYEGDPWQAQFLWPIFKSNIAGSELAADGPAVREDVPPAPSNDRPKQPGGSLAPTYGD